MAYELPALAYPKDALEPHIDALTMEIHHDRHHKAYVDNLNKAIAGTELAGKSIDEILKISSKLPPAVINNGGGHANHTLFWEIMGPKGGGEPGGDLAKAITDAFGSFSKFKEKLSQAGLTRFGSGWGWLILAGGKLQILSTANQDSPYMNGQVPIFGVDVWEHAYYLKYQNKRPDYIDAWWNVVNWGAIAKRYADAKAGKV